MTDYLIEGPISSEIIAHLLDISGGMSDTGAHSVFIGRVRADETGNKKVVAINYSAYNEMVYTEAEKIKEEIQSEFKDLKSIYILHSTGIVKAGQISLFVLVSSCHRQQAISACSKTVELIKGKLPVWKNELFDNDTHEWRQNNPV
jgi:molybdopterin synthase catalytic subunit